MPWKIRNIDMTGEEPVVQIFDHKNRIYLDVEMSDPKEAHVYIGDEDPERSRLHIIVDADGFHIARAVGFRSWDLMVMDNILSTMGHPKHVRKQVLRPLHQVLSTPKSERSPGPASLDPVSLNVAS